MAKTIAAAAGLLYLLLLGRSAWKQGEFSQFLWALAIIAGLLATLAGSIYIALQLDR
jgi:hypothetical protein